MKYREIKQIDDRKELEIEKINCFLVGGGGT